MFSILLLTNIHFLHFKNNKIHKEPSGDPHRESNRGNAAQQRERCCSIIPSMMNLFLYRDGEHWDGMAFVTRLPSSMLITLMPIGHLDNLRDTDHSRLGIPHMSRSLDYLTSCLVIPSYHIKHWQENIYSLPNTSCPPTSVIVRLTFSTSPSSGHNVMPNLCKNSVKPTIPEN